MANNESLAKEIQDIRKVVEEMDQKIDQILSIMETFAELQEAEYEDCDDEDSCDGNEGWVTDVEWFASDEDDEDSE